MLSWISDRLQSALSSLTGKGVITETDLDAALRELRVGLLEADVALPAIKHLLGTVREKAVGQAVLKGVNPGQQVVKLVYDGLVELLGGEESAEFNLNGAPPVVLLLCGLQGSGKTTTAGKIAKRLKERHSKNVLMASLDVHRPAAIDQLATLAAQVGVPALQSDSMDAVKRAKEALAAAKKQSADVLILDTAGRLDVDAELMDELKQIHAVAKPQSVLLVADAQTGQVAVKVAEAFKAAVPLTGLVLTRLDGDARGGAALSLRHTTGVPIVLAGMGEAMDKIEPFRPDGVAGRILGQGDVVALVDKMSQAAAEEDTKGLEQKFMNGGTFDMNDVAKQIRMMRRMGGFSSMLDLLPGMGGMGSALKGAASKIDPKMLDRQLAIISSMTPAERKNPIVLNAKRRARIAKGAGQTVNDVNKLVKMHEQLNSVTKMFRSKGGMAALMKGMK